MIPALTVRQPWASAFFRDLGPKDVENRGWSTRHVGPLAIHAGLTVDRDAFEELTFDDRDRGVILGTVELTGCHDAGTPGCDAHRCGQSPWAFWPSDPFPRGGVQRIVHWTVEHPRLFATPIRARGAVGLWHPDDALGYLIETAEVA